MQTNRFSNLRWFILGLIGSMVICLVLVGLGVGVYRIASDLVANVDDATLPPLTRTNEVPPTMTAAVTPTVIAGEAGFALATKNLLASVDIPINDRVELTERLKGVSGIPRTLAESAAPIPVGTIQEFWVSDVDLNTNFEIDAELVYSTEHVYFWIERGVDYGLSQVKDLVDDFESNAYPTNRAFFGSEWSPGIDGDPHLYILYARGLGSVNGYFSTSDEFPPQAHEYSNGHEMFYLSADYADLNDLYTFSTLAHEFQHMIHWYLDRNEESWMNEGFSEVAAHINGFDVGGWDFVYASDPDIPLTFWPDPTTGQSGVHYGQSFLFLAYFLDRFGAEITQQLVANPANGLDSIDLTFSSLGLMDPLTNLPLMADDVHRDWAVTLLLQDNSVGDGRYDYSSYFSPVAGFSDEIESCPVNEQVREVNQYGIDYIRIRCRGEYNFTIEGAELVPVVPGEPFSGDFSFWSNRGDESDMTLTRSFDLRQAEGPILLEYWVWYDIEKDWDYLYVEASSDQGDTWQLLTTPSGTDENPSGNSFGWGYTGMSGGGVDAEWIQETVDLSEFAGKEILLRFEYVTDAAVNGEGLLLDDLSITAIDFFDDFEKDGEGWQSEGFVRLYNRLPQTYRVVLVEHGSETEVQDVHLNDDGQGEVSLDLGGEFDEATIIVIGTARDTWQPTTYRFSVHPVP